VKSPAHGLGDSGELGDRGDVAEQQATGGESIGDDSETFPGGEHVEHDPVDGAVPDGGGEGFDEVADRHGPVLGFRPEEGDDVATSDIGKFLATLEGGERSGGSDATEQPETEGPRSDPRFDDGRTGKDVTEAENLCRILRVDDGSSSGHRHHEITQ
jgi:hypothetical protein